MSDKTCLLDATVHVLNLDTWRNPDFIPEANELCCIESHQAIINFIGHDGSERGFHSQEIIDAVREVAKVIIVPQEAYPAMRFLNAGQFVTQLIYPREEIEARFLPRLNKNNGVLIVEAGPIHHALAFQKGSNTAYDVKKDVFLPLEDLVPIRFLEFISENN